MRESRPTASAPPSPYLLSGTTVLLVNEFTAHFENRLTDCSVSSCWICRSGHARSSKVPRNESWNTLHGHNLIGAEGGTRTPTVLLPPAPQAGASANSATSAKRRARGLRCRTLILPCRVSGAPVASASGAHRPTIIARIPAYSGARHNGRPGERGSSRETSDRREYRTGSPTSGS